MPPPTEPRNPNPNPKPSPANNVVTINVGGELFQTTAETIHTEGTARGMSHPLTMIVQNVEFNIASFSATFSLRFICTLCIVRSVHIRNLDADIGCSLNTSAPVILKLDSLCIVRSVSIRNVGCSPNTSAPVILKLDIAIATGAVFPVFREDEWLNSINKDTSEGMRSGHRCQRPYWDTKKTHLK